MTSQIAVLVWAIGLIIWTVVRIPHRRRARRVGVNSDERTLADRLALSIATLSLSVIPIVYIVTGFPSGADYSFQSWLAWIGLFVQIAFLLIFYISHRQLGRNWSVSLQIREKHELVTEGIYRYVRHPMYLSFWLWAVAQFCLLPNWFAGGAGIVGVGILYFCRVSQEEAMMRTHFGPDYDEYSKRTGRVVPKFW
ncbi:protein-S-isoprenylcysteine O-methyltransferase [Brucella sp. NBRC 12950]|uniref:protein-S-isoprenylcysteine O-methyltransferase n=1 Tax=Brucella sp. NBRC 12950 TaxID=2994518 RepID=UPI0024A0D8CF|nr:protein-S-isoprenylcysteine O-methyltransferase [Brucella sp. NBRC 12950]GLU29291.1 farnesyl cysteine carboxyl-methyltransferase [Brucella sp. NBRC 12950]